MFVGNEFAQACETPNHSANTFASPICIASPKEDTVSVPSNVFSCLYIAIFMRQNIFTKNVLFRNQFLTDLFS